MTINNETYALIGIVIIAICSMFTMGPEHANVVAGAGIGGLVGYLKGYSDAGKNNQNG